MVSRPGGAACTAGRRRKQRRRGRDVARPGEGRVYL